MKTLVCRDLGNNCSWMHKERTEELLLDVAAIHLRDVHGVKALSPDTVGRIKNAFNDQESREPALEASDENPVLKEFLCKDLGMDCTWRYIAQTEELLADGVAVHARDAHGITEFTPEMAVKVKTLAHEWQG